MYLLRRLWLICSHGETDLLDLGLGGALAVLGLFIAAPQTAVFALPSFQPLLSLGVHETVFGGVYLVGGLFKIGATVAMAWPLRIASAVIGVGLWLFLCCVVVIGNPDQPLWAFCALGAVYSLAMVARHAVDRDLDGYG